MSGDTPKRASWNRGPIAWMTQNPVAANLLMVIILVAGAVGLFRVKQEVFPTFETDVVLVAVPYPGASPDEVEQGIVLAVEEAVRGLDGVKRVTGVAAESGGTVQVQLLVGTEPEKALQDVKSAVDRIQSFPLDAERPEVRIVSGRQKVVSLIISGDQSHHTLLALGEEARARMLATEQVTQVQLEGMRPQEISVNIPRQTLESLGLTLEEVGMQIRASSLDLPGGAVRTEGGELLVRVADRRRRGSEFEDIVLRATTDGSMVRLGEVADVVDDFAEDDLFAYYNGENAVRVVAYRVGEETPRSVSTAVKEVTAGLRDELPSTVDLAIWDDDSQMLDERIGLLTRNARLGLILVLLVLTAFLELRLAFWVALGIPISFLGAFFLMPMVDISVNMVTLFAFIVTLGMVVDDAIIVGENVYSARQRGVPPLQAAVQGAQEMSVPVTFSILTTVAAFSPMMFVPGFMGKLFRLMPTIVMLVLLFSLIESFFILPAHLAHSSTRPLPRFLGLIERGQRAMAALLQAFTQGPYERFLRVVVSYRYFTLAAALAVFIFSLGITAAGVLPFSFFPKLEGDLVRAQVRLPYGAPVASTEAVRDSLEVSLAQTVEAFGGPSIVQGQYTVVGEGPPVWGGRDAAQGSHLLTVELELVGSDQRDFSALEFSGSWRENTPPIAGVETLVFESSTGPGAGAAVDAQLGHPDQEVLAAAAADIAQTLRTYPSLANVQNGWSAGKPQLDFHLLPEARTLGITANDLARQLRSAFYGAEALREQRDRNEVKVMVRLPPEQRRSEYDLERLMIRTPQGQPVPLGQVASLERGRAPTDIKRENGARVVNVTADLAPGVKTSSDVIADLQERVFGELVEKYPGLSIELVGERREQGETLSSLGQNGLLALFVMYALLAIPFRSYVQPLIVMVGAIPMGVVGAIWGHILMGYTWSIISMFGVVALAGVVVNDSLVLIDATNRARKDGLSAVEAVIYGGKRRLRPILLTSLTTFFGLFPMILETSIQAQFLIPMAISLGFGVLFATVIILVLVPALYMVVDDCEHLIAVGLAWMFPPEVDAPAAVGK